MTYINSWRRVKMIRRAPAAPAANAVPKLVDMVIALWIWYICVYIICHVYIYIYIYDSIKDSCMVRLPTARSGRAPQVRRRDSDTVACIRDAYIIIVYLSLYIYIYIHMITIIMIMIMIIMIIIINKLVVIITWGLRPPHIYATDEKTGWKVSFENAKSGAGLQFLLPGRMGRGPRKRSVFFTDSDTPGLVCSMTSPVWEKTLLSWKPLPSSPATKTALQPLIWCSESLYSNVSSSPEEFFSQTPVPRPSPHPDASGRESALELIGGQSNRERDNDNNNNNN